MLSRWPEARIRFVKRHMRPSTMLQPFHCEVVDMVDLDECPEEMKRQLKVQFDVKEKECTGTE